MNVDPKDVEAAKTILISGEHVEGSATQRRFGPGGSLTSPTTVLVTDKRIIVIKRATFGLRHDYEVFSLSTITSIKLKHGFVSSSIFVRTQGSESDRGDTSGKQEGEIFGLMKNDAEGLANLINGNLAKREASEKHHQRTNEHHIRGGGHHFCSKCGMQVPKTATFCKSCGARI